MATLHRVAVRLGPRRYKVWIGTGQVRSLGVSLRRLQLGTHAVLLSNSTLLSWYAGPLRRAIRRGGFPVRVLRIADTERSKSMRTLERVLNQLADGDGPGRRLFLVLLGGGVVGDLGALAAGLYRRGVPYVQIPTTLLAQVDSAIGGKAAVDLPHGKNLAGLIVQPKGVWVDLDFLNTLPDRQFRSGMAEVIKSAVIGDAQLFAALERTSVARLRRDLKQLAWVIARAVRVKTSVVERDEFETKGIRSLLNFGHTLGHALEAASGYSRAYTHGEAVALGMQAAAAIARRLKIFSKAHAVRLEQLLRRLELPVRIRGRGLSERAVFRAMAHDKKWAAGKRWVLPTRIGRARWVAGIPERVVRDSVRSLWED